MSSRLTTRSSQCAPLQLVNYLIREVIKKRLIKYDSPTIYVLLSHFVTFSNVLLTCFGEHI